MTLNEKSKKARGIEIWIVPLSLCAGLSTENMGPSCFVLTVFAIIWHFVRKRKPPVYLFEGAFFSLIGSALMILAPGNFVRNQFIEKTSLRQLIENRYDNLLTSGCGYLFPAFLFAVIIFTFQITYFKNEIKIRDIALFAFAVIAEGAMVLSPTYPQRASFGIMCALIAYIVSFIAKMIKRGKAYEISAIILTFSVYIHSLTAVMTDIIFRPF